MMRNLNFLRTWPKALLNFINLQNYRLSQLIDPNQLIQFYRTLNNPVFFSNINNQIASNVENTKNETYHANYNQLIKNDSKCSCSVCTQITDNIQKQQAIWQAHFKEQQDANVQYPISLALNSASLLLTITPKFHHELMNPLKTNTNEEKPQNNSKTKISLEDLTNEEIVEDFDDSSSNDSKSHNDQASYNYKRKLIDRYISNGEGSLKRQKLEGSKSLETFLQINAVNSNRLKYTDTVNSYLNNQNINLQLS